MPQTQDSLNSSVRTESRTGLLTQFNARWNDATSAPGHAVVFDWEDRTALMDEIAFVNEARERLDELAVKIAPSMLRIVLTVKANIPDAPAQRAFLAEHMDWDFRRISELCIVADSYCLLDPASREAGQAELHRYGWSNALKLAYVRDPSARREIWERASGGQDRASYRAVLDEMRRFRERKLVGPPVPEQEIGEHLRSARARFTALDSLSVDLSSGDRYPEALQQVDHLRRELGKLRRALQQRMEVKEVETLAANT